MPIRLLTYALHLQADVVGARQRARQIAELLGFGPRDQTAIATSVSEIARNAFRYAGGGHVEFEIEGETPPQLLTIRIRDEGPGIEHLDDVLDGTYRSSTGMGIGLIGSRRLMDRWAITSTPATGTTVTLGKLLPEGLPLITPQHAGKLMARLAAMPVATSLAEMQSQNAELLGTLSELRDKQDKLVEMARELEDTNRGVVALYAELDEKAGHLRRADEMKSRFLSNMSHEFRTPLNSIRALCKLLLDENEEKLTHDQEVQVRYIAKATQDLSELVNDLLDIAKIEAGKLEVRPATFVAADLFSALRGMLRPLLVSERVDLVFEDASSLPPMHTDESKVSQILRNFISNGLKFTERGSVTVRAQRDGDNHALFSVVDTGIGIAPDHLELIFEEFTQVPNKMQAAVKGTGLGLPLCRRLAQLLGGEVGVRSAPGEGSTFWARIPLRLTPQAADEEPAAHAPESGKWVLIVEDDDATRVLYEKFLKESPFRAVGVPTLAGARSLLRSSRPTAVILDILLPGEEQQTWRWLAETKATDPALPIVVVSSSLDEQKANALGADAYFHKPVGRDTLLDTLTRLTANESEPVALIIDDDAAARYVIRRSIGRALRYAEAGDGVAGLDLASKLVPRVIFLDLSMPGMRGEEVLERLRAEPTTADIPVIVVTSHDLDSGDRARVSRRAQAVLQKDDLNVETLTGTLERVMTERAAP